MPVTNVTHDLDSRTLTIHAEFSAPIDRVWDIYADPRKLEKIWGPPQYPATVVDHELKTGGRVNYYMTGPEGDKHCGFWNVLEVDEPHRFVFEDGFADAEFNPVPEMPVSKSVFSFAEESGRTTATFISTYETAEALQQVLDMGMIEGATAAMNQIDAVLAG